MAATRYPPAGVRGVAGTTRATRFGRVKDYAKRAHEEICVLVQVETKPALDQLEAICAVDGVDGVFIGPADLHASMGYPGEIANPAVLPLIEEAMRRIRKAGKAPGYLSPVEADAKRMLGCGLPVLRGRRRRRHARARRRSAARQNSRIMKHEIIITAQGHKGTLERLQSEFSAIKLWEAPDRDAALKAAAHSARRSRISAMPRWTAS